MPFVVRAAVRTFALLQRMLPRSLSAKYGREILADFEDLASRAQAQRGGWGVTAVLLRSSWDLLLRAPQEQWLESHDAFDDLRSPRAHLGDYMQYLTQELKQAARSMRKRPGYTLIAVLTLALGIGANVAIFAVVNAVLIRPLPYPESERIVWIKHHAPGLSLPELENSAGTLLLYQQHARSFASQAALVVYEENLTGITEPSRVSVMRATPSLFDVLELQPLLGRLPTAEEAPKEGAPTVALMTYRGWQKHFAGARDVLGKTVQLNGTTTEIIGVLPRQFAHPDRDVEVVLPYAINPAEGFGSFGAGGIARLKPGVTVEAAAQEIAQLQTRIPELYPDVKADFLKKAGWSSSVLTFRDRLVGDAETALWIVLGTVGFLLLVACASVANLFLVRAEARQRETSVRFALGATRTRVALTFLSESMLLGLAGGAWGLLLAYYGVRALTAAGPEQLPRLQEVSLDWTVIGFAFLISVAAGLIFGVLPLPQQMRRPLHGIARDGRGQTGGVDRQRVRKTLIVAQIALAFVMATCSGLMLRSFQRLRAVDPGVRPEGVITMSVSMGEQHTKETAAPVYQRMIDEIRALPGVVKVGAVNALPLDPDGLNGGSFSIRSKPRAEDALPPVSMYSVVTQDYFEAIGTRVLQGRGIERADHEQKRNVVVVSQAFARQFLDNNAIGQQVFFGTDSTWLEVVGVVADVRTFGLSEEIRPMAYVTMKNPVSGARIGMMNLIVRTNGDPLALVAPMRAAVRRIDPNVPVISARTMQQVVDESMAETSFTMTILLLAAIVALLLGSIGLYGVIGYVVSQRTQEIGVRIALGAVPAQVQALVLRQGVALAVLGVAIGFAGALAASRALRSLLFEVQVRDPLTFAIVPVVMLLVSGVATYLPARRAAGVSPLQALRSE